MSASQEAERRLHPLTIVFEFVRGLREYVVPLALGALASRSARFILIGSVVLVSFALIRAVLGWFTYRFRYDDDDLVVRSGKIFRNERHIPYSRIQNIDAVQNVAHRLFGVAVVLVQTGSGSEPEATMRVLPLSALAEMRARVLAERDAAVAARDSALAVGSDAVAAGGVTAPGGAGFGDVSANAAPVAEKLPPVTLLHLPSRELLLAGLIENRGMALIVATIAALSRIDPLEEMVLDRVGHLVPDWVHANANAEVATRVGGAVMLGVVVLLLVLLFVRALSTVWALVRLYDFTLTRDGDDLRAEYGLFTRVTSTIPVKRVQTISLHQRFLHRRTDRAAIRVTTAGGADISGAGAQGKEREWLAPIVPVAQVLPLLRQLDPSISLDDVAWRAAHPGAVWRLFRVSTAWGAALTAVAAWFVGWWSLAIAAVLLVRAVARSRGIVRNLGIALTDERAFFRSGWFDRVTTVVRFERLQSTNFSQSFFDRRKDMATVSADSAGMGSGSLQMPYLRREDAVACHEQLAQAAVRTPFTW